MTFYKKRPIPELRRWRGDYSLAQASDLLRVTRSTLWRWEEGERRIPGERVQEVSYLTGLAPEVLRPDIFRRQP